MPQTPPAQWASFDNMVPVDRVSLTNMIHSATMRDVADADEYYLKDYKDRMSPEFYQATLANIKSERAARIAKIEAAEAQMRTRNNAKWDAWHAGNGWQIRTQPTNSYGDNIGTRAYKWTRNFKGTNGDWYAEYQPVRGGSTRKFYNLSLSHWSDDYMMRVRCDSCHSSYIGMSPMSRQTCPSCGNTQNLGYGGRV